MEIKNFWGFLLFCSIFATVVCNERAPDADCKVDLAFLVDTSNSLYAQYFKQKVFVIRFAAKFGISEKCRRATVITFSESRLSKVVIRLNRYYDTQSFVIAVNELPEQYGYFTRIDLALKFAKQSLFSAKEGARKNSRKVILVLSDGKQNPLKHENKTYNPAPLADELRNLGVELYALLVGQDTNKEAMKDITNNEKNIFDFKTYDDILSTDIAGAVYDRIFPPKLTIGDNTRPKPTLLSIKQKPFTNNVEEASRRRTPDPQLTAEYVVPTMPTKVSTLDADEVIASNVLTVFPTVNKFTTDFINGQKEVEESRKTQSATEREMDKDGKGGGDPSSSAKMTGNNKGKKTDPPVGRMTKFRENNFLKTTLVPPNTVAALLGDKKGAKEKREKEQGVKGKEKREQGEKEQGEREQIEKEQGEREQREKEQGEREQREKEQGEREQGEREQGEREQGEREQGEKERGAKERGAKKQGEREQGEREPGENEQGAKDQGEKEQGEKDQGEKDQGEKDQGEKKQGKREQGEKDQGKREQGEKGKGESKQGEKDQGENNQKKITGDPKTLKKPSLGSNATERKNNENESDSTKTKKDQNLNNQKGDNLDNFRERSEKEGKGIVKQLELGSPVEVETSAKETKTSPNKLNPPMKETEILGERTEKSQKEVKISKDEAAVSNKGKIIKKEEVEIEVLDEKNSSVTEGTESSAKDPNSKTQIVTSPEEGKTSPDNTTPTVKEYKKTVTENTVSSKPKTPIATSKTAHSKDTKNSDKNVISSEKGRDSFDGKGVSISEEAKKSKGKVTPTKPQPFEAGIEDPEKKQKTTGELKNEKKNINNKSLKKDKVKEGLSMSMIKDQDSRKTEAQDQQGVKREDTKLSGKDQDGEKIDEDRKGKDSVNLEETVPTSTGKTNKSISSTVKTLDKNKSKDKEPVESGSKKGIKDTTTKVKATDTDSNTRKEPTSKQNVFVDENNSKTIGSVEPQNDKINRKDKSSKTSSLVIENIKKKTESALRDKENTSIDTSKQDGAATGGKTAKGETRETGSVGKATISSSTISKDNEKKKGKIHSKKERKTKTSTTDKEQETELKEQDEERNMDENRHVMELLIQIEPEEGESESASEKVISEFRDKVDLDKFMKSSRSQVRSKNEKSKVENKMHTGDNTLESKEEGNPETKRIGKSKEDTVKKDNENKEKSKKLGRERKEKDNKHSGKGKQGTDTLKRKAGDKRKEKITSKLVRIEGGMTNEDKKMKVRDNLERTAKDKSKKEGVNGKGSNDKEKAAKNKNEALNLNRKKQGMEERNQEGEKKTSLTNGNYKEKDTDVRKGNNKTPNRNGKDNVKVVKEHNKQEKEVTIKTQTLKEKRENEKVDGKTWESKVKGNKQKDMKDGKEKEVAKAPNTNQEEYSSHDNKGFNDRMKPQKKKEKKDTLGVTKKEDIREKLKMERQKISDSKNALKTTEENTGEPVYKDTGDDSQTTKAINKKGKKEVGEDGRRTKAQVSETKLPDRNILGLNTEALEKNIPTKDSVDWKREQQLKGKKENEEESKSLEDANGKEKMTTLISIKKGKSMGQNIADEEVEISDKENKESSKEEMKQEIKSTKRDEKKNKDEKISRQNKKKGSKKNDYTRKTGNEKGTEFGKKTSGNGRDKTNSEEMDLKPSLDHRNKEKEIETQKVEGLLKEIKSKVVKANEQRKKEGKNYDQGKVQERQQREEKGKEVLSKLERKATIESAETTAGSVALKKKKSEKEANERDPSILTRGDKGFDFFVHGKLSDGSQLKQENAWNTDAPKSYSTSEHSEESGDTKTTELPETISKKEKTSKYGKVENEVKSVSSQLQEEVQLENRSKAPGKTTTAATQVCDSCDCTKCCKAKSSSVSNVFINVLDNAYGYNYVVNGVPVSGGISQTLSTKDTSVGSLTAKDVGELVEGVVTDPKSIATIVNTFAAKSNLKKDNDQRRKKRSKINGNNMQWKTIDVYTSAYLLGSRNFIRALKALRLIRYVAEGRGRKPLIIFAPSEFAYFEGITSLYTMDLDHMKDRLSYHITVAEGSDSSLFRSVDGKHVLRMYRNVSSSTSKENHLVENAAVVGGPYQATNGIIYVIDKILQPPSKTLAELISINPNLTVFNSMLQKSGLIEEMRNGVGPEMKEVCVDASFCFKAKEDMQRRLRQAVTGKQYTIYAPTDDQMALVPKSTMSTVLANQKLLRFVVGSYITYGATFSCAVNERTRSFAPTMGLGNVLFVTSADRYGNLEYSDVFGKVLLKSSVKDIRARDGVLHIIDGKV